MLLVLFGPSCSGKSSVASIIRDRRGASVWTGRDYLRLAKSEQRAWRSFLDLLIAAAGNSGMSEDSIVYVAADVGYVRRVVEQAHGAVPVRLVADLATLESRFAPRVGGAISPAIRAMLKRSRDAAAEEPAALAFDTTKMSGEEVAESILKWCANRGADAR